MVPNRGNTRPKQGSIGDIGPHGVTLGTNLLPQDWTIRVTDDEGGYELVGSVTGTDGAGHVLQPFTSTSGQIRIPPKLWRHSAGCVPFLHPWDGKIINREGDTYTFSVYRACQPKVNFQGDGGEFRMPVLQAVPNREHLLEIIAVGDGSIQLKRFDIFQPPLH